MLKFGSLLITLGVIMLSACTPEPKSETQGIEMNIEYKPMIFAQDTLYGDTGRVVIKSESGFIEQEPEGSIEERGGWVAIELPNNIVSIGFVENIVSQSEPMVHENFTSNIELYYGKEIFHSEENAHLIFVEISDGRFSIFELI